MPAPPPTPLASFKLPALRSLGELADTSPIIIVDTREQEPLTFTHLESRRGTLMSGDYSVVGLENLFAVERKSIADLASCCVGENRSRLERECHRLRGFRFKRLLIVGTEEQIFRAQYHSSVAPKAILATLSAFEVRWDLPVVFCETPEKAALQIERWAFYYSREVVEGANNLLRGCRELFT